MIKSIIDYNFELFPISTPILIRNNERFVCLEKFRINSQKSLSDVWLVYKSKKNNATWNMTILSRVNLITKGKSRVT